MFCGALLAYAVWPWLPFARARRPHRTLVFYGFSILGDVMNKGIFPAFEKAWTAEGGEPIEFATSFAGSGTITNQILLGVPAQLALLSLESDADRLADAGVVKPGSWRKLPYGGVVNLTPFIIAVRPGNPQRIEDFADLARSGVGVVHPDPATSGGANWSILAEYGAGVREAGGNAEAGEKLLMGVWKNVVAQAASARAARVQFDQGFGDALITYEQEPLWDRTRGKFHGEIVYPRRTILSEHTLVVIDKHIHRSERAAVKRFTEFLWSDEAQKIFVAYGFRSVRDELNAANTAFGKIADPFRISDFGGWKRARREIVDGVWKQRVMPNVHPRCPPSLPPARAGLERGYPWASC
ncbi:MAG TPA: substrate-binding domain-containing protein [Thermoanaerobaculia bacterium]